MSAAVTGGGGRQSGAQAYLQRNRIGPLFEELMAGLIREQPQEPLLHLMRILQRKAGERGLAMSMPPAASGSEPPRPSTAAPAKSLTATTTVGQRAYDKPWLTKSVGGSGVRKSSSSGKNIAAASLADPASFERHHQKPHASIGDVSNSGDAVYLWSAGEAAASAAVAAPAVATNVTAASIAEAEADILGGEFRQTAEAASKSTVNGDGKIGGVGEANYRRPPKSAAGRLAAKQARMRQLEAALEAKKGQPSQGNFGGAGGVGEATANGEGEDFEAEGVLLLEDADELAAEGVRVSRRQPGVGRGAVVAAAARRREADAAPQAVPTTEEPQVRMTFCGRCFALIAGDETDGTLDAAAVTASVPNSARDVVDGGFLAGVDDNGVGVDVDVDGGVGFDVEELEEQPPATGRTNATMTEVTDIESASQVTGPRRPSWGGGGSSRQGHRRSGASGMPTAPLGSNRSRGSGGGGGGGVFDSFESRSGGNGGVGVGIGVGGSGGGWAAVTAEEDSDEDTTARDRHQQQDIRLY